MRDPSRGRVGRIDPQQPKIMAADEPAMIPELMDRAVLAVAARVETVARMGRDHLERIALNERRRSQAFPRRNVAIESRTVGIVRRVPLEDFRNELEFSAWRLQALAEFFSKLRRKWVRFRHVLAPAF